MSEVHQLKAIVNSDPASSETPSLPVRCISFNNSNGYLLLPRKKADRRARISPPFGLQNKSRPRGITAMAMLPLPINTRENQHGFASFSASSFIISLNAPLWDGFLDFNMATCRVASLHVSRRLISVARPRPQVTSRVRGPIVVSPGSWTTARIALSLYSTETKARPTLAPQVERGVSKLFKDADEAVADLKSGSTILSAGFGLCGVAGRNCTDQKEKQ